MAPEDAVRQLSMAPFESLDFATIDHHRALRQGYPEVVYGEGKNPQQVVAITERIMEHGHAALVTRTDASTRQALVARFPDAVVNEEERFGMAIPVIVALIAIIFLVVIALYWLN